MAYSINSVLLYGNITKDLELKHSANGGASIVNFTIATNESYLDAQKQRKTSSEFHRVTAFNNTAEFIYKYFKKGDKIIIQGKLKTRSWEGEDGIKRYQTEIIILNAYIVEKKNKSTDETDQEDQTLTEDTILSKPAPFGNLHDLPF